ncbi:hypothetical protein ACIA5D_20125 [Actinoplanes sp. NPDC051513]|uniref:hypothetical protein n=1 Tax=Actinoplanes sp. NPDC051513 TaxID=3363908 RepID=UPI003788ADDE
MATAENSGQPAGYDRLLNIAASAVTVAAGVLGVFGIGTGIVAGLLRNAPEATLTSTCTAGIAVLAGLASALVRTDATVRESSRTVRVALVAAGLLAAVMWVLVGFIYQRDGARTTFDALAWYGFIALIVVGTGVGIFWVAMRESRRLRTGLALTGVFLFGSSVLATVVLATATLRTTARPTIAADVQPTAEPAGYVTLIGKVSAAGLANNERYEIVAHLLTATDTTTGSAEIYRAYVGPDKDGAVAYSFTIAFARDATHPWLGVTAQVVGEGENSTGAVSNCGLAAERGVSCTIVRVPEALPSPAPSRSG